MDILDRLGTSALFARVDFSHPHPGKAWASRSEICPSEQRIAFLSIVFARAGSWALYETREWIKAPGRKEVKESRRRGK
jgi:hypothetical protein